MGTDIFIEDTGESAINETADVVEEQRDNVEEVGLEEVPLQEVACKSDSEDETEEAEEILPLEFLENPELCSAVLPAEAINPGSSLLETSISTPEQLRKSRASSGVKSRQLSSRRKASASQGGSRRSQKIDLENLSPEELAAMKKNDRKAKLMIYAVLLFFALVFVALFTYKLPGLLPDRFPNGIWPWNQILPQYTGQ